MDRRRLHRLTASVVALLALTALHVRANADADRAAIVQRPPRLTEAFHARDAVAACNILAPNLIADPPNSLDTGGRP